MANVNIELGYKNLAWFTANPTIVLLAGQIVYLEQTGTYKIGDGVTQLSVLNFLGISSETQTLQNVTDLGNTTTNEIDTAGITTDYVQLDLTTVNTNAVGKLTWNNTDGTLDLGLKGGNVTLQIGQETVARVVNKTGTNITLLEANYQAVRVTGAVGQRPKVDLALANNDLNSATTLGLVTETILNNDEGFINTSGQVREINTTGSLQGETWLDGDVLYLSGTVAGQITNIKPFAPIHTVIIGFVEYAHAIHGKIFVKVNNGYELEELHNVNAIAPNNNEVLTYDTPTLLWKPKTVITALGYTPYNSTNPSGYITSSALTPYLTSATAASTYYPLTNPSGYITGITSGMVTTALGFTPYNATNPSGYITSSALTPYAPLSNPTFTTAITTPIINGVSGLLSFGSTDRVSVGNYATPSAQRIFTIGQDTAWVSIGSLVGATNYGAIFINQTTPSLANAAMFATSGAVTVQGTANVYISAGNFNSIALSRTNMSLGPYNSVSGATSAFTITNPVNTGQTASTAVAGWNYNGGSRQWNTGAIATQSEIVWGATTYSFVGASTITNAYGNVFNAPVAGTNCTITNRFAALFNQQISLTQTVTTETAVQTRTVTIVINGVTYKLLAA